MSAHTPGPWGTRQRYNLTRDSIGTEDRALCTVWVREQPANIADHDAQIWAEGEANARLIAAAPDLLAALVMVRDADNDCALDGLQRIPPIARALIDAAIAKAEGRP